jgi:hypothetical protein
MKLATSAALTFLLRACCINPTPAIRPSAAGPALDPATLPSGAGPSEEAPVELEEPMMPAPTPSTDVLPRVEITDESGGGDFDGRVLERVIRTTVAECRASLEAAHVRVHIPPTGRITNVRFRESDAFSRCAQPLLTDLQLPEAPNAGTVEYELAITR